MAMAHSLGFINSSCHYCRPFYSKAEENTKDKIFNKMLYE